MSDLDNFRGIIDKCDQDIVKALEKRFKAVKDVRDYKEQNNMPILQQGREDEVLQKVVTYQNSNEFKEEIRSIYIYIMEKSKELQKKN